MEQTLLEVRGDSLSGVLENGDQIILLPAPEQIKRDVLVVFKNTPSDPGINVKICKGVPGDQIAFNSETKEIMVNGKIMPVKFSNDAQIHCWKDWIRFCSKVPDGYLFLLGTKEDAIDSRQRGYISLEQVVGIAQKVLLNTSSTL